MSVPAAYVMRMPYLTSESRLTLLAVIGICLGVTGFIGWQCVSSDGIPFLTPHGGAEWIVYPVPTFAGMQDVVEVTGTFERSFTLEAAPASAPLAVRAFRRCTVSVNGSPIQFSRTEASWKRGRESDVAGLLRVGENRISVSVSNAAGPPALWLRLRVGAQSVATDAGWEATIAGSVVRPARLASAAMGPLTTGPVVPQPSGSGRLSPASLANGGRSTPHAPGSSAGSAARVGASYFKAPESFVARLRTIVSFGLLSAVALAGVQLVRCRRRERELCDEGRLRRGAPLAAVVVAAVLWIALFANNLRSLYRTAGYDAVYHLDYVQYLLDRNRLPLANEGWEMYQPPLYYLVSAATLRLVGLSTLDETGVAVVRLLMLPAAIAQVGLIFASLRLMFPTHPRIQAAGLVLAMFLPPHLFLFHYTTNEGLATMLASAAVYVGLRILSVPRGSTTAYLVLGLCLGAAMLTKFTAVLVAPPILAVLAGRLVRQRERRLGEWGRTLGVAVAAALAVSGWHFVRVWMHFGNPLVGNWDPKSGFAWWQHPGYQTASYYGRFGRSLVEPFYSAFNGFPDAMYSTLWGDGNLGGEENPRFCPPWNYDLVAAGYVLAIVPMVAVLVGLGRAGVELIRRPRGQWFLVLGVAFAVALPVFYMTLRVPSYAQAKAFYGLPAMVSVCALGAYGFDLLARRWRAVGILLSVALGTWAANAYASYWIRAESAGTQAILARGLGAAGRHVEALERYRRALAIDPHHIGARWGLADTLAQLGRDDESIAEFQSALADNPDDVECYASLASVLDRRGRTAEAVELTRRLIALAPDHRSGYAQLGFFLNRLGRTNEAVAAFREALRMVPADSLLHHNIALGYARLGNAEAAAEHQRYALQFRPAR